jgi:MFS transporter, DHA1 family, multidrug resistance protein
MSGLTEEIYQDEERMEHYGGDDVHEPDELPELVASAVTTVAAVTVVDWDGPDDPENPQNWSDRKKWAITLLLCALTLNVYVDLRFLLSRAKSIECFVVYVYRTFASSAPTTATLQIVEYFGISMEVSNLLTTLFLLGYVLGPILWGPGSELVGRRPIFIVCLSTYTILHLGQALAHNIETLLITRFLAGVFAVAPLTIVGGSIADIWSPKGRGNATSLFTACVFFGPVLGPIIGGL